MPRIVSDGWLCVVCAGPIISPEEIMFFNGHKPRLSEFRPLISQPYLEKGET